MRSRSPIIALVLTLFPLTLLGRVAPARQLPGSPSDADVRQAISAIELADGYADLLTATERYEAAICSTRMVDLVDARLQGAALDDNQRGLLLLERQLSLDCRARGARPAARALGIRLVAGYALLANSPAQFAGVLDKFSPLEREISAQLVRDAMNTPGNKWPPALLPLMEQLARDWPALGSMAAATRMAEAASGSAGQMPPSPAAPPPAPARGPTLAGHWLSTTIEFDSPRDEHLVIRPDGTAETWIVTASGRTPVTRGRWRTQGTMLQVDWADGRQWGQPFTFFERQLVFPNVAGRRQFWDAIE